MDSEKVDNTNTVKDTEEIALKEIFVRLKKAYAYILFKWKPILIISFLGGIIGFLYAYTTPIIFTSKTTFVLEDAQQGSTFGQYAGLASMVGVDLGGGVGGIFQNDNLIELYKSDMMIRKVLLTGVIINGRMEYLINRYLSFKKLREKWTSDTQLAKLDFTDNHLQPANERLKDSLITSFVDDVRSKYLEVFKPDKKLNIFEVDVKSPDETFSKVFNDVIVSKVSDFYISTKTKKSLINLRIIQHQTDSIRSELNGAIYQVASNIDVNPNANPTRQILKVPSQRRQIDAEANKAILTEMVKNLEVSKISLRKETPLIQVIDQSGYPLKQIKKGKLITALQFALLFIFLTVIFLFFKKLFAYLKTL